jgi:L-fuconolactonase
MVFLECFTGFEDDDREYLEEVRFVEDEAKRDPRLKAIVPMAPLEDGDGSRGVLDVMASEHPAVRGIRRIVEFDDDPRALTLSDGFVRGVNLLHENDYHFEINVNHTRMDILRDS